MLKNCNEKIKVKWEHQYRPKKDCLLIDIQYIPARLLEVSDNNGIIIVVNKKF